MLIRNNKYFNISMLILWSLLIFVLSHTPNLKISDDTMFDLILRKLAHITEYFILYILAFRVFNKKLYAFIYALLFAISDEYHQTFIEGRSGAVMDVMIDSIGIVLANWGGFWRILAYKSKSEGEVNK